jgi:hypothetical protein
MKGVRLFGGSTVRAFFRKGTAELPNGRTAERFGVGSG